MSRLLPFLIFLAVLRSTPAAAEERERWDATVVGVQSATVVGHAAGHGLGWLVGGTIALTVCPIFDPQRKCSATRETMMSVVVVSATTIFGSLLGALSTWGAGRLLDAPGKFLPTLGYAAIGHALGGVTTLVWTTLGDEDTAWSASIVIGPVLGTGGAIFGFQRSF